MTGSEAAPAILVSTSGERIAYHHTPGCLPGVVFCAGFKSDMQGGKALALERWCRARGRQFTRFDYGGHGLSSGEFSQGTIGAWRDDGLAVLDQVTTGPQVIVGSSMGGWMMLLLALARPERVAALVGVAAAPDFTRDLLERRLDGAQRSELARTGYCELPNDYDDGTPHRIGQQLLDEARDHMLLEGEIDVNVPVRLLHGQRDPDVPWQRALEIARLLRSRDVELQLIKSGEHRLSGERDIARMLATLATLLDDLAAH